jgi:hypothetical protein
MERVLWPMEPVEPRMASLFKMLVYFLVPLLSLARSRQAGRMHSASSKESLIKSRFCKGTISMTALNGIEGAAKAAKSAGGDGQRKTHSGLQVVSGQ